MAPSGGFSLVARTFREARSATSIACVAATIAAACQAGSKSTLAKNTALETLTFSLRLMWRGNCCASTPAASSVITSNQSTGRSPGRRARPATKIPAAASATAKR